MALPLGELARERLRRLSRPLGEGGCDQREQTEGVPRLRGADFPSFRPKFHVSERKSQTIKQSAQKGGAKFGGDGFDRSREKVFEKQNDELKRVIATK